MSRIEKVVLSYPKLQSEIGDDKEKKKEALADLHEIQAEFSPLVAKNFTRILEPFIGKLYDAVNLEIPAGMDFPKLVKENNVVLVPNHQSHADYIALNYAVYKEFEIPVYVAGGINLNVFPIGSLFKKSGCFFIRRTFANDVIYKYTLEAYLYYLLMEGIPIEFFFEGGRSRSGKLLPPKYGLYQMLLEAHSHLPEDKKRELLFVPVSISHEYVPEQKSLARELTGGKKKKESTKQLLKLYKIFSYQFGSVHLRLGQPIPVKTGGELREKTQNLAFNCFRSVGKNIPVTPMSLVSLVLLDEYMGAVQWEDLLSKGKGIVAFCKKFDIPVTKSLEEDQFVSSIERAIDILIANKKVNVIGAQNVGHVFYSIKEETRVEMLYFKNSILHHFLVPWIINVVWTNIFNGTVEKVEDLRGIFLEQRDQLKYEFYLPTVRDFFSSALRMISDAIGREVTNFEQIMEITTDHKAMYTIVSKLGSFARACSYIIEGYYISAKTIRALALEDSKITFTKEEFDHKVEEVYKVERAHGRIVKYPETASKPLRDSSLKYYEYAKAIIEVEGEEGKYKIQDIDKLNRFMKNFVDDLKTQRMLNIKGEL